MKLEIFQSDFGTSVTLVPESVEDTSLLLQLAKSSKRQTPEIVVKFNKDIQCDIWIEKLSKKVQKNYISNQ